MVLCRDVADTNELGWENVKKLTSKSKAIQVWQSCVKLVLSLADIVPVTKLEAIWVLQIG